TLFLYLITRARVLYLQTAFSAGSVRTVFYARSVDIPLPRTDRLGIASQCLPNPFLRRAVSPLSFFLRFRFRQGRAKRVYFTLDDARIKQAYQGWMVSRSEAIHLPDRFLFFGFD
ncbi:hypothetical protein ACI3BU_004538, partial [Salmonella enterica subsp. enterica serovar Rubislaw]